MGIESLIGLIGVGMIVIAFVAAYIQHKLQRRTAETIRNARGDDIARIRALVDARDSDKISAANFHEEINVIRKRQSQSKPIPHQRLRENAPIYSESYKANLEDTDKHKRTNARPTLSNRMAVIIAIVIVIVYVILSEGSGANQGNEDTGSARAVATATFIPTRQPSASVRRTKALRATTAPVDWDAPETGVLYEFQSKDFREDSEPGYLPVAELGSLYLPPSAVRYEITRHSDGLAEVRLLDLSDGCLPHSGKDIVILPYGPANPTIYLLSQGQGCRFNAEIEWFDSRWSFWISNESAETAGRVEARNSNATVSTRSSSSNIFSITPAAPQFNIIVGGEVNLRQGPGTQFAIVGSILGGNTIEVIGTTIGESLQGDSQWYQVSFRGRDAFIANALTVRAN